MSSFSKLHRAIIHSSIWRADDQIRIVWVTMLAMKDRRGHVRASVGGLSDAAKVPVEDVERALGSFLSPDPDSKTKTDEGRRVRAIDGGWEIINHRKYSAARDDEERRKQNREAQQRRRKKTEPTAPTSPDMGNPITVKKTPKDVNQSQPPSSPVSREVDSTLDLSAACQPPSATVSNGGPQGTLFPEPPHPSAPPKESKADKAERERQNRFPTSEPAKRISALFRRRLTTAWAPDEVEVFRKLGPIDLDDLTVIEAYYARERAKGDDGDNAGRHRRDLKTFLNNYITELDRARVSAPKPKTSVVDDPAGWRDWLATQKPPIEYKPYRFAQEIVRKEFGKSER